jgi:type III restriction enzyme
MDEGHKAYTASAMSTLYGFNPCFVLELSATPKDRPKDNPPRYANWLVDVRGTDLQREEMIKLPINVKVKAGDDWKDCLRESLEELNVLQTRSDKVRANTARYIRPILLVQAERTGKDQREKNAIHSEDVREFLLSLGVDQAEIAVKTSETNELNAPENIDLLSPTCAVRVIITKQALQEGWDCPFAYVLCALAASHNQNAMTQLVGRILRQPDATNTTEPPLNECYVFCHHVKTKDAIEAIKKGLEQDGMADIADQVRESKSGKADDQPKRKLWIQGWRKNRVYPDFIFARERTGGTGKIFVWEMKGDQLEGNLDTIYMRKLLKAMKTHYRAEDGVKAGTLQLIGQAGEAIECDLVLMSEWKTGVLEKLAD